MGSLIAGVVVAMSLGWVGPDLETELAAEVPIATLPACRGGSRAKPVVAA